MSTFGLILFVLFIAVSVALLIDDGHRVLTGKMTITQWVVKKRYRIYAVVGAALIGPAGLLLHFVTFTNG